MSRKDRKAIRSEVRSIQLKGEKMSETIIRLMDELRGMEERFGTFCEHANLALQHSNDLYISAGRALRDLIDLRDGSQENKWDAQAVARLDEIYKLVGKRPPGQFKPGPPKRPIG